MPISATAATRRSSWRGSTTCAGSTSVDELERLLAGPGALDTPLGLTDGTVVTLRFPDGDEATHRIVAIPEQGAADDQDDVVTTDSPLGRALVGRGAGDTVIYQGPDGELQADVVAVHAP